MLCHVLSHRADGEHNIFPHHFQLNHSLKESFHFQIALVIVSVDCLGLVWETLKLLQSNLICVIRAGFVVVQSGNGTGFPPITPRPCFTL